MNALQLIRAAVEPNAHTLREHFISLLRQPDCNATMRRYTIKLHGDKVAGRTVMDVHVTAPNGTVFEYVAEYSRMNDEVQVFGGVNKIVIRSARSPRDLLNQIAMHTGADAERNDG